VNGYRTLSLLGILGTLNRALVTVGTSLALLAAVNGNPKLRQVQNQGTAAVFLGPSSVAASGAHQGFSLAAGTMYRDGASADAWYGIAATGSVAVVVITVT
jgi:hypothetical protein